MYEEIYLKYFMWAHQHSTHSNIERYAEELFEEILPNFKPKVFLLGILRGDKENSHPICIQPEECGIDVALFAEVDKLSDSILRKRKEGPQIMYGMPYIQDNYEDYVKRDSVRVAVQQLVDQNFKEKPLKSFVSQSVELENYEIFVVFQINDEIYDSFFGINETKYSKRYSLLDSLISKFLEISLETLYRPRAATGPQSIYADKRDVLRKAALNFVNEAISAVGQPKGSIGFFDTYNYISSLKYEGSSSMGKIIVCKENHPNLEILLKLAKPVQLGEFRKVRKLLEIASRDLYLYINGSQILGLGKTKAEFDEINKDMITIEFSGQHKWELTHDQQKLLIVEYANPNLPKPKINKGVFDDVLKRIFADISNQDLESLWKIVETATFQKHGTLLVISKESEKESRRLSNQATRIEPTTLNESLIRNVTSIDGAILLDSKGKCHSIGVILDGIATNNGRSDRGSRYNSAIRYVDNNKKKCVAIIISEDGMVDFYPILRPMIKRSKIEEQLGEFRRISQEEILDDERYASVMGWFSQNEFYLSLDQCSEINKIKKECDQKTRKYPYRAIVLWNDVRPDSEMDDSYFLNE